MSRMSTPPSRRAFSTPAARSPARRCANISASRAAATPVPPVRYTTRIAPAIRLAAPPREAPPSSLRARVPMALGGDQGGSIRIPASFCGIYGLKPTHGLVPYTGIMPIELTLDHTGPMTATVEDNALLLEVLAG